MRTGQRFYPPFIRTIWATECLEKTQDFPTAATMLGDTLQVVMQTHYDVDQKDHHAKARACRDSKLPTRAERGGGNDARGPEVSLVWTRAPSRPLGA